MFDGVPADQFHQFIAAASRTSLPIPLSFPLHGAASPAPPPAPPPAAADFPSFDPYPTHQTLQHVAHHHHSFHQLHHHHQLTTSTTTKDEKNDATNLMIDERDDRSITESADPWSNDEVLTLLRIRSSMDSWFPDFTWERISRKLAEVGFKRSAEKCEEKFEEESRHFNNFSYNKNYRFFTSELDELYQTDHQNHQVLTHEKHQNSEKENEDIEENSANPSQENEEMKKPDDDKSCKKRKRKYCRFEMLKGFCEAIVNKIMAQQEELHNKFIEDLLKRDEEMVAKEEAWKNQEIDRLNKEIEIRAKEQAIANDRQAILIELLKKITSNSLAMEVEDPSPGMSSTRILLLESSARVQTPSWKSQIDPISTSPKNPNGPSSSSDQNPNDYSLQNTNHVVNETSSSTQSLTTQNPNSSKMQENIPSLHTPSSSSYKGSNKRESDDVGKRWPRDEVLALIKLKSSIIININNNNNNHNHNDDDIIIKEGISTKGPPLWERISQGMQQLGYKRSSKRCKEKWENINKYFRKTKDNNKKRSLDSRTCPYFHQLNSLYNQGILVAPTDVVPENRSTCPENHLTVSENTSMAPASPNDHVTAATAAADGDQLPSVQVSIN